MSEESGEDDTGDKNKQNVTLRDPTLDELAEMYPEALSPAERIRMAIVDAKRFTESLED